MVWLALFVRVMAGTELALSLVLSAQLGSDARVIFNRAAITLAFYWLSGCPYYIHNFF